MRPFGYERAADLASATRLGAATDRGPVEADTQFLAGGTTLIDLMKLDVLRPKKIVDLNGLPGHNTIDINQGGIRLGALASMAAVADDAEVRQRYPLIAQSLELAASAQLRNMASVGGNVLQKTRCPFYRDPTWPACNKRAPGSGCTALNGINHNHAILGVDDSCIAQYPGDLGIALIALDASVELQGHSGSRHIAFKDLHRSADGKPHLETILEPGEIITAFNIPALPWARRSIYLKIRDRASYEFAIASVAVALDLSGDTVRDVRLGLGGMAYRPWRALAAEEMLRGKPLNETTASSAAAKALEGARTHGHNDYKPTLARAAIVRALLEAQRLSIGAGA